MTVAAVNGLQLAIVLVLFAFVTVVGFAAVHWRKAASLQDIDEWGLGGRKFGGWVTWFLLDGDLYTAYTFVAVPALVDPGAGDRDHPPAGEDVTRPEDYEAEGDEPVRPLPATPEQEPEPVSR